MISYIRSFIILMACLYAGKGIVWLTNIPISASIIGMLLLFCLLALHILPSLWVKEGSSLLVKHMTLFFVPIGVGLMQHFSILRAQGPALLISTLGSSLIVFVIIGKMNHIIATKYEKKQLNDEEKS